MPTDSLLVSLFIICVFVLFAAVLAWADHRTTTWQKEQSAKSPSASLNLKKAA